MTKDHGGQRKGAGRPALTEGERVRAITVTLSERDIAFLEQAGGGNRSEGVRQAVEALRERGAHALV